MSDTCQLCGHECKVVFVISERLWDAVRAGTLEGTGKAWSKPGTAMVCSVCMVFPVLEMDWGNVFSDGLPEFPGGMNITVNAAPRGGPSEQNAAAPPDEG